jgi:endonuclease/exonuclease/phosphatase (EEP) superfamily protein YafD
MIRRLLAAAVIVVLAIALLVLAWPQLFSLERSPLIVQAIAFRGALVVVAVIGAILFVALALLWRAARRFAASVAVLLLLFSAGTAAVLLHRGAGNIGFQTAAPSDITVLSWNTLGDAPGAKDIADLALTQGADVVTMPETTVELGNAVAAIMAAAGKPMAVLSVHFDLISKARSTTMLVSTALGAYAVDTAAGSTKQLPSIVAKPVNGVGPTLMAVHPVAPNPVDLPVWRSDLDWLAHTCVGDNVIMAGDFNSTVDHYAHLPHAAGATIGDCADAALATGNGAVGSWPTSVPALLGTPIDHVMATKNWRVTGMRVIQSQDAAGSDHRPIVAQLTPAPKD